jgi:multiple sugar transport system substrate-binding protein
VSSGTGIYGYPNGPSPFVLFCNQDVLNQFGIAVPTTWDALAAAAAQLHSKDKTRYLTTWEAYPSHFFGLLENGGATPFQVNGHDITINFSSPEAMRVADYWTSLVRSGNLSSAASFSNDWNTALGNGTIACWLSGNWGSKVIAGGAPSATGKWKMNLMPQWTAGAEFNGNWGGNDFVVLKSTPHPQEAETFIRWMGTDPPTTVARTVAPFNNFPSSVSALQDPTFLNYHDPYFDQDINKVAVLAAKQANPAWEWAPFMGYVYATLGDEMLTFTAGNETMGQALKNLETKSKEYATSQGYTVK